MLKRPEFKRAGKQGQLIDWPDGSVTPQQVAALAKLTGNTEHKDYPSRFGPPALHSDKSKCGKYRDLDWPQLQAALAKAIESGSVGKFRGNFPSRVWVWINDVLHEAKLENQELGHYHGYPVLAAENTLSPDELKAVPRVQIPLD